MGDENLIRKFAMKQNRYVASLESITLKGYTNIDETLDTKCGKKITLREILLFSKDPDGYYFFEMIERASDNRIFLVYTKTDNIQQQRRDIRSFIPQLKKELHEKITPESLEKIISNQDNIYTYNENKKPNKSFTTALNTYANILLANPQDQEPTEEINAQPKKKPKKFFFTQQTSTPHTSNSTTSYAQILSQPNPELQANNQPEYNHNPSPLSDTSDTFKKQFHIPNETTQPNKETHTVYTTDKDTTIMQKLENTTLKLENINKNHIRAMEKIESQDKHILMITNIIDNFAQQFTNIEDRQTKIETQMTAQHKSLQQLTSNIDQLTHYLIGNLPPNQNNLQPPHLLTPLRGQTITQLTPTLTPTNRQPITTAVADGMPL